MTLTDDLIGQARQWLADDPDEEMRAQLTAVIGAAESGDATAHAELADAFDGMLAFGTAGLRGTIGPGPRRMNQVVVARTAAGLARYLMERGGGTVVIGHDARRGSEVFARVSAEIMTAAGLTVVAMPRPLPTPLVAFAIRHLDCVAGVMVTASHNPPQDNGYKVYLGDGVQIVSPADADISACIAEVTGPVTDIPRSDHWTVLGEDIVDAYVAKAVGLVEGGEALNVRVAYTPVHGVGGPVFCRVLSEAGFPAPAVVDSQFTPDPEFGGMPFPNPEEPGVMDAVIDLARSEGCDIAIANDPDADRCAAAVPTADGWRMLTGDEVGALLGWWIAAGNRRLSGRNVFAQSIVSGTLLQAIAEDAGLPYAQTLTGFKWIARVPELAFGYEEALGYCVDPAGVSDKDGITAGLMLAEMAGRLSERGADLPQILDELALRHGVYATGQVSIRHTDPEYITGLVDALRTSPPSKLGGLDVLQVDDLERPTDGLPPTNGLRFLLADHGRVIVRPSGTEPKIKSYLQVRQAVESDDLVTARAQCAERLTAVADDMQTLLS